MSKKEQIKEVYKIKIDNKGILRTQQHSYQNEEKWQCPFQSYEYRECGKWCIHFGEVEQETGNYDYYNEDYDSYYALRLTCGCGITIKAMEYENEKF